MLCVRWYELLDTEPFSSFLEGEDGLGEGLTWRRQARTRVRMCQFFKAAKPRAPLVRGRHDSG